MTPSEEGLAESLQPCGKCGAPAHLVVPLKVVSKKMAVYGCPACGHTFRYGGAVFLENPDQLRDTFRAATLGQEMFGDQKMDPSLALMFQARLMEFGTHMFYDGVKQGLLLGALQLSSKEKSDG
jgi:hypothetical protein